MLAHGRGGEGYKTKYKDLLIHSFYTHTHTLSLSHTHTQTQSISCTFTWAHAADEGDGNLFRDKSSFTINFYYQPLKQDKTLANPNGEKV
jgi:hypothetical protein